MFEVVLAYKYFLFFTILTAQKTFDDSVQVQKIL